MKEGRREEKGRSKKANEGRKRVGKEEEKTRTKRTERRKTGRDRKKRKKGEMRKPGERAEFGQECFPMKETCRQKWSRETCLIVLSALSVSSFDKC